MRSFAEQEVYRVAGKGCRVGLIRPIDALGDFPLQPKYGRVWRAMEETGVVYGETAALRRPRNP
jgi:hypothetical protein